MNRTKQESVERCNIHISAFSCCVSFTPWNEKAVNFILGENWECLYLYLKYGLKRWCSNEKRALLSRCGPLYFTSPSPRLITALFDHLLMKTLTVLNVHMFPLMSVRPPTCLCESWTGTYSASVVFEINLFCSSPGFYLSPCCQLPSSYWTSHGCISSSLHFFKTLECSSGVTGTQCFAAPGALLRNRVWSSALEEWL